MRRRWRVVLAGALACALIFPVVALAASGLLDQVTYDLPSGWTTAEKASNKEGPPFGYITLKSPPLQDGNGAAANVLMYIMYNQEQRFATLEEFSVFNPDAGASDQGDILARATAHSEAVTFKGKPAWKKTMTTVTTKGNLHTSQNAGKAPVEIGRQIDTWYYYNTPDGHSVQVIAYASTRGSMLGQLDSLQSQTEGVIESIKFGQPPPPDPTGMPWRTVLAGAAALAAAATAMAGAFLSTPEGRRRAKEDPNICLLYTSDAADE